MFPRLTLKQWRVYAAFFAGKSYREIANEFGMRENNVPSCIERAKKACPILPDPIRADTRHMIQISQTENCRGESLLKSLGIC